MKTTTKYQSHGLYFKYLHVKLVNEDELNQNIWYFIVIENPSPNTLKKNCDTAYLNISFLGEQIP